MSTAFPGHPLPSVQVCSFHMQTILSTKVDICSHVKYHYLSGIEMDKLPDFSAVNDRFKQLTERLQQLNLLMRRAAEIFRKFQWTLYEDAGCPHGHSDEGLDSWLKEQARIDEALYREKSEWDNYLERLKNRFQKESY